VPSVGLQSATGGLSTNHRSSVTEVAS
jgi:hypothetical protein